MHACCFWSAGQVCVCFSDPKFGIMVQSVVENYLCDEPTKQKYCVLSKRRVFFFFLCRGSNDSSFEVGKTTISHKTASTWKVPSEHSSGAQEKETKTASWEVTPTGGFFVAGSQSAALDALRFRSWGNFSQFAQILRSFWQRVCSSWRQKGEFNVEI